jgi:hypothetical protein
VDGGTKGEEFFLGAVLVDELHLSSFWVPDQNVMTIMCRREKEEGLTIDEGWTENEQNSREKRPEGRSPGKHKRAVFGVLILTCRGRVGHVSMRNSTSPRQRFLPSGEIHRSPYPVRALDGHVMHEDSGVDGLQST